MASVACTLAAGEPPDQEGVDGAEGEMAGLGERARALHVVEQPGDLGGREIGVEQQAGLGRDHRLVPGALQRAAHVGGAPVLPDDGAVDRLARAPVPDDAGLALVGDADGGDVARRRAWPRPAPAARSPPSCARCPPDRAPPSPRPGSAGRTRAAPSPRTRKSGAEHDGAARGGALIDRQNRARLGHAPLSSGCPHAGLRRHAHDLGESRAARQAGDFRARRVLGYLDG